MAESEIPNIDWSNPDVMRLFGWCKEQIDGLERDKQQLNATIEQPESKIEQPESKIEQLEREKKQLVAQLAKARGTEGAKSVAETPEPAETPGGGRQEEGAADRGRAAVPPAAAAAAADGGILPKKDQRAQQKRGYNVRSFKGYPHPTTPPKKPVPEGVEPQERTADVDQKFCHECGDPMSDWCEKDGRSIRDLLGGKWTKTKYTVTRRYCKKCGKKRTPPPIRGGAPKRAVRNQHNLDHCLSPLPWNLL